MNSFRLFTITTLITASFIVENNSFSKRFAAPEKIEKIEKSFKATIDDIDTRIEKTNDPVRKAELESLKKSLVDVQKAFSKTKSLEELQADLKKFNSTKNLKLAVVDYVKSDVTGNTLKDAPAVFDHIILPRQGNRHNNAANIKDLPRGEFFGKSLSPLIKKNFETQRDISWTREIAPVLKMLKDNSPISKGSNAFEKAMNGPNKEIVADYVASVVEAGGFKNADQAKAVLELAFDKNGNLDPAVLKGTEIVRSEGAKTGFFSLSSLSEFKNLRKLDNASLIKNLGLLEGAINKANQLPKKQITKLANSYIGRIKNPADAKKVYAEIASKHDPFQAYKIQVEMSRQILEIEKNKGTNSEYYTDIKTLENGLKYDEARVGDLAIQIAHVKTLQKSGKLNSNEGLAALASLRRSMTHMGSDSHVLNSRLGKTAYEDMLARLCPE